MQKKILFFGTPEIAVPSLEKIAALPEYEIVGVGVFPDRKVGRKQTLTPCPVKVAATELQLPVYEITLKSDLEAVFNEVKCDLAIVIAFGFMFPETVLEQPPLGVVNVHFSLLPAFRGASPVQSAILEGLEQTGITWQKMVKALDAGDILWQTKHSIAHQTTAEVWHDFSHYTAAAFPEFLDAYFNNTLDPVPQIESLATYCGKFTREDGQLDHHRLSAQTIYNTWRAFQPWPGVTLNSNRGPLKLLQVSLDPAPNRFALPCAKQSILHVGSVQLPGKRPQSLNTLLKHFPDLLER